MPQPITITRSDVTTHGSYRAELAGSDHPATLSWRARGGTRIAQSTFVPPEMRGRGVARQLVEALVADARAQGFTIVPQCSYVDALFRRHPEWADLLAEPGS